MLITNNNKLSIVKLTLGPYKTNAYILVCNRSKKSLVIDAPAESDKIVEALKNTDPQAMLLTHDHPDHTGAIEELRFRLKVPLDTHEYSSLQLKPPPEILLQDEDEIQLGSLKVYVIYTPGHTPGSLCFKTDKYLFAGDTIFPGGPGHTNTSEDFRLILQSIEKKIYTLPDETLILPGHGDSITVFQSKEEYKIFLSKTHGVLCGDVTWFS